MTDGSGGSNGRVSVVVFRPLDAVAGIQYNVGGGGGRIFRHLENDQLLVKQFYEPVGNDRVVAPLTGKKAQNLLRVIACESLSRPSTWLQLAERFALPIEPFGTSDLIDAVSIPRAPERFFGLYRFDSADPGKITDQAVEWLCIEPNAIRPGLADSVGLQDRIELMLEFIRSFRLLWSLGLVYNDFSAKNLWWTVTPHPAVYVIDVDGCSPIGTPGLRSPDWHEASGIAPGSLESDRSKLALLLWRILARKLQDRPHSGATHGFLEKAPGVVDALVELHSRGDEDSLRQLVDILEPLRSPAHRQRQWEWAERQQYARLIVDAAGPDRQRTEIVKFAKLQMEAEAELESLPPLQRNLALRSRHPHPGFRWDLTPLTVTDQPGQRDVLELALRGRWDEIAEHIAGLSSPEIGSVERQALGYFLHQFGQPNAAANSPRPDGSVVVTWSWPSHPLLDCVLLHVVRADGTVQQTIERRRDRDISPVPRVVLTAPSEAGGTLRLAVAFGFHHGLREPVWLENRADSIFPILIQFPDRRRTRDSDLSRRHDQPTEVMTTISPIAEASDEQRVADPMAVPPPPAPKVNHVTNAPPVGGPRPQATGAVRVGRWARIAARVRRPWRRKRNP